MTALVDLPCCAAGYRGFGASYAGDYYVVPASAGVLRRELFGAAAETPR